MNSYTIIDDGDGLWVADTDDLRHELLEQGWTIYSAPAGAIEEPEVPEEAYPGDAYTDLCAAVTAVAGASSITGIRGGDIWAAYPGANVMRFDPASGERMWSWEDGQTDSSLPKRVYRVEDGDAEDVSDDPLANPVDSEESILVIARTEEEAVWIAAECDAEATTVHQPDNKNWHGTTIVAAVRREDVRQTMSKGDAE